MSEKIAVIGLGYVGLPLLMGLARHFGNNVVGFDIDQLRVKALRDDHHDWTTEVDDKALSDTQAQFSSDAAILKNCTFFIVTVPTPIDQAKRPDLTPVLGACKTIGTALKGRATTSPVPLVVFESTVYPGLTEEICGSKIAEASGLAHGTGFKLGYSPERINPGDKKNRLETITKIISAEDDESLARMEKVYGAVIEAGLFKASNIRVAEAAKVLENTQRDINIALMNELAIICDKIGIRTHEVLEAAGTKWNFLKFTPGLVGGHCIGVDPYYLTYRAEELGYIPQVILSGRRINDNVPIFVAQKTIKLMAEGNGLHANAKVGIMGLTFKENVRDLRNSRVPEIVEELKSFGVQVIVHDPVVDPDHAKHEYGITLAPRDALKDLDAIVFAVPHEIFLKDMKHYLAALKPKGWMIDVKSALDPKALPATTQYWSL